MSFQDEMKRTYDMSHSPAALKERENPDYHDYNSASDYLSFLKERIRAQLTAAGEERQVTGHAILGKGMIPEESEYLLVDGTHEKPSRLGFSKQYLGVYLTEKSYVFLKDLAELAAKDGIEVGFGLNYQGHCMPLPVNELSLGRQYLLSHTNRLTPYQPRLRVSYSYRVA